MWLKLRLATGRLLAKDRVQLFRCHAFWSTDVGGNLADTSEKFLLGVLVGGSGTAKS